MAKLKSNDLSNEIAKALKTYTNGVTMDLERVKTEVTKDTVKILKETSPKQTGSYAKGWAVTKVGTAQVIYNRTDYQLTHLLEYGHIKVNGGRVAPKVHIRPAEEKAIKEYVEKVERALKEWSL